jgi:hypothetical protein
MITTNVVCSGIAWSASTSSRANRVVADRLFEPCACQRRDQAENVMTAH